MTNNDHQLVYKPDVSGNNMQELFWSNVSKVGHGKNMFQQYKIRSGETILEMNSMFQHIVGKDIRLTLRSNEMTFLDKPIRPLFIGKVVQVTNGYITLDPVAVFLTKQKRYQFQTPLHFPIERISNFILEEQEDEK